MCAEIKCMNFRRLALAVIGVCVLFIACLVIYLESNNRHKLAPWEWTHMLPQAAAYHKMAKASNSSIVYSTANIETLHGARESPTNASIEKAKTPVVDIPLDCVTIPLDKSIGKLMTPIVAMSHGNIGTPLDSSMGDRLKPMVVICVPTRSQADWWDLAETGLQTILIPSLARTVTPAELDTYRVHMYLGINHDDVFWIKNTAKLSKSDWLVVHVGFYKITEHRVPFNEVTKAAYDDGAEYIVRINDDTEFITAAWITAGIKTLSGYDPPNVGVVGPTCNEGNTAIMTHDMVHRTHIDIFGDYYPPVFDNVFVDDWITHVYEPGRSTKLRGWVVKHHISKHGTRYSPNYDQRRLLNSEIEKGKVTLLKYLQLGDTETSDRIVMEETYF